MNRLAGHSRFFLRRRTEGNFNHYITLQSVQGEERILPELFHISRHYKATNLLDKLYAIFSFLSAEELKIHFCESTTVSHWDVYTKLPYTSFQIIEIWTYYHTRNT